MGEERNRTVIALIHAIPDTIPVAMAAFEQGWPDADPINLVDDSLFNDLQAGKLSAPTVIDRFIALTLYAARPTLAGRKADAILFCCSAFGYAIEEARKAVPIAVLTPAEAALEQALEAGGKIGLIVSAEGAVQPLRAELSAIAEKLSQRFELRPIVVEDAMRALRAGRPDEHDDLVAEAATTLVDVDALVLGQFTMARAAPRIPTVSGRKVFTTPGSAVSKLRSSLERTRRAA